MKSIPGVTPLADAPPSGADKAPAKAADFGALLTQAIDTLNAGELKADAATRGYLTGEVRDLHQVIIAVREAELKMQLALEVRNKFVEAYQEISRIPV